MCDNFNLKLDCLVRWREVSVASLGNILLWWHLVPQEATVSHCSCQSQNFSQQGNFTVGYLVTAYKK